MSEPASHKGWTKTNEIHRLTPANQQPTFMNKAALRTLILAAMASMSLMTHPASLSASESPQFGNGLELGAADSMPVVVEDLSPEAEKRGLTRGLIEARVNSVLRKSGIKPFDPTGDDKRGPTAYFLNIRVSIVGSALSINLFFTRRVSYTDGHAQFVMLADTWKRGITGDLPSGNQHILDLVGEKTELFANEFLKANSK